MKRTFQFLLGCMVLLQATMLLAQPITLEAMMGNTNYYYQHSLGGAINNTRIGFFHSSSLHAMNEAEEREKNELMSQAYLTYEINKTFTLAVGTFYATAPGISPAVALHLKFQHNYFRALIVPRIDLKSNGSYEMMTLLYYNPPITKIISLHSRAQLMTNYGNHHNRSYQNFRLGLEHKRTAAGFAINIDERGKEIQTQYNWGVFVRYML